MRPNHILHAVLSRQSLSLRLECLPGPGHVTVHGPDADHWDEDSLPDLIAKGVVDEEHCWTEEWLDECGDACIDGDDWPEDGPWPVRCWFDGDSMRIEHAPDPEIAP